MSNSALWKEVKVNPRNAPLTVTSVLVRKVGCPMYTPSHVLGHIQPAARAAESAEQNEVGLLNARER